MKYIRNYIKDNGEYIKYYMYKLCLCLMYVFFDTIFKIDTFVETLSQFWYFLWILNICCKE